MTHTYKPSVLTSLRAVIPQRDASFLEALRTAEIQAAKLEVIALMQQGITRLDVVNYIAHGISKVPGHADHSDGEQDMQDEEGGEKARGLYGLSWWRLL